MFILRTVFWLSLVVLILPTDARQQEMMTTRVVSSVQHLSTFCDRNIKTCETGARYWGIFRQKADYGLQLALSLIAKQFSGADDDTTSPLQRSSTGTLRPTDLAPAWRGTSAQGHI